MSRLLVALLALLVTPAAIAAPVDVQTTEDARADVIAVSLTGDAQGFYALSGTGEANGTVPFSLFGSCRTYFRWGPSVYYDSRPCYEVTPTGNARGYYLAISGTGDANSAFLGLSGTGDVSGAQGCLGHHAIAIASSTCGNEQGYVFLSGTGDTRGRHAYASMSGAGDAQGGILAASILGDARQNENVTVGLAISVAGDASTYEFDTCLAISPRGMTIGAGTAYGTWGRDSNMRSGGVMLLA